jgi:hypothetical protein
MTLGVWRGFTLTTLATPVLVATSIVLSSCVGSGSRDAGTGNSRASFSSIAAESPGANGYGCIPRVAKLVKGHSGI